MPRREGDECPLTDDMGRSKEETDSEEDRWEKRLLSAWDKEGVEVIS